MTSIAHTSFARRAALTGALGVTMAFAGFGSAAAQGVDLRSPDAKDASGTYTQPSYVDLRSPDAKDAGVTASTGVDLRSPDAKDAGRPAQAPTAQPATHARRLVLQRLAAAGHRREHAGPGAGRAHHDAAPAQASRDGGSRLTEPTAAAPPQGDAAVSRAAQI